MQKNQIVACTITTGEEHDSPQLREMFKQLPEYTGADITYVMGDKAYNAKKN